MNNTDQRLLPFSRTTNLQMDYFVGVCIYYESITVARHKLDIYGDIQNTCGVSRHMQKSIPNGGF